ncbi:glycerol-3-phosphate dehydrogenase [Roseibium aestuarii]|uniref:Glycerol-3-phosphate dehydrogenase n=1 Tax=Roseibium aestuarii TaxID=2600299 RepID=A0ABW4JVG1_9HYPH|nr:glycerol-3-phosphate dehydrogenase [Roseibium aestuarii]
MSQHDGENKIYDLFIVGGGVNGCGIARDAAGRGLSVMLAEMNDLGSATSSSSTKLFHGGLRYLEYFEFRLVREALIEREVLLSAMPHISWPMRFVLPYHQDMRFEGSTPTSRLLNTFMPWMKGRRPAWLIRLGLFLYDHLGGRKILPGTTTVSLKGTPEGAPLQDRFAKAYEYSDCWIEDSRLVILNARDAEQRGAVIRPRTRVVSAHGEDGLWSVEIRDEATGETSTVCARMVINAGGPWVGDILRQTVRANTRESVRLVRGSHIVTRKLYDHDKCYFLQGTDGRIIFAIPYERDFTLIGTTDSDHPDPYTKPVCTDEEKAYLVNFASQYFKTPVSVDDILWSYSGVRPLYDDGASSATAATRDYTLKLERISGAPLLNIFGGKITTYRRLAESAMDLVGEVFPDLKGKWTARVPLPGGDFPVGDFEAMVGKLHKAYPFLTREWAWRLVRAYGTDAWNLMAEAASAQDMGRDFGATLSEREVRWLRDREYARTAEDIVWRRNKLGLRMTPAQIDDLDQWMKEHGAEGQTAQAH